MHMQAGKPVVIVRLVAFWLVLLAIQTHLEEIPANVLKLHLAAFEGDCQLHLVPLQRCVAALLSFQGDRVVHQCRQENRVRHMHHRNSCLHILL